MDVLEGSLMFRHLFWCLAVAQAGVIEEGRGALTNTNRALWGAHPKLSNCHPKISAFSKHQQPRLSRIPPHLLRSSYFAESALPASQPLSVDTRIFYYSRFLYFGSTSCPTRIQSHPPLPPNFFPFPPQPPHTNLSPPLWTTTHFHP